MERDQAQKRKEMLISLMEEDTYVPMRRRELAVLLSVPSEERRVFHEILDELVSEGQVEVSKRGKYSRARHRQVVGQFMATSRGFGFVAVDGMEEDIFIPEHAVGVAMNGDTVAVRLEQGRRGKRPEGVIEKVLIHAVHQVVGTYDASKKFGFVIPDNAKYGRDLFIPKEYDLGAVSGHKVVAEITDYGSEDKNPEGRIVEIIGHVNDPGVDIISIVRAYGLPDEFSDEVLRAAAKTPEQLAPEDYSGRKDLRDLQTVTIDGEDAKDLDDAITISRSENGFVLGVHIADVSHYVRENSPLDREARKRGTSVYLVDRVIPMLPHRLSNGICSLNAGCDRLALSCMMEIDDKGIVTGHEICESVIRVDERMSYTSVRKILQDHDASECARYEKLVPMFQDMEQLAAILQKKRRKRGFVDFDFPETKIVLDEKGHPVSVAPYERNVATKIIEDFMLAANETVAEEFFWREVPFVYRTHETPDAEKMARLEVLISNFGYYIKNTKESIHPKELQKLLEKIEDTPEEALGEVNIFSGGYPMHYLADMLTRRGRIRIGSDSPGSPAFQGYQGPSIPELLPDYDFVLLPKMIEEMRKIKSPFEISMIKESARWGNLAMALLQEYTRPGERELDVVNRACHEATQAMLRTLGADFIPGGVFWVGAHGNYRGQIGVDSALPHALIKNVKFKEGDVVNGSGTTYPILGYISEMERTMFVGEPSAEQRKYFNLACELQDYAFHCVRAGRTCGDVDRDVRGFYKEHGIADYWMHHTGHALGMDRHEPPFLDIAEETVIQPGMVFSIEPGIYIPGFGGFRHSDTIHVTQTGIELLTYYPRELERLICG